MDPFEGQFSTKLMSSAVNFPSGFKVLTKWFNLSTLVNCPSTFAASRNANWNNPVIWNLNTKQLKKTITERGKYLIHKNIPIEMILSSADALRTLLMTDNRLIH